MPQRTLVIDVGGRPHQVALENPGPAIPDGDGGFTQEYAPLTPPTWWCSMKPATMADSQRMVAGTMQTTATHLLQGTFHPGITTETRIRYRGRRFEVQSVQNDDERDISLTLVCAEIKGSTDGSAQRTDDSGAGGTPSGPAQTPAGLSD